MQGKKSIKVNSILNIIKTISSIIFPLITFPYISRILQPENVGKVNFGSSYVSYFSLIASLGITTYAIRECSAARENKKRLSKTASEIYSINICTTIIAYVLLVASLVLFRRLDSYRTLITIQSTAILFTTWGADWLNSAMEDFKYITIRSLVFQIISLILMFLFIKNPDDYLKYAAISVIASCGANLTHIFYRRKYCVVSFTKNMYWNVHFKPILLLFVMIMAQSIFSNADVTMLGLMRSDYEVGIYSTAHKIEGIVSQVVSSLAWVVMPRMSLYFSEGNFDKINAMLKKSLEVLMIIGLPCIAGSFALSKEIVLIVGGADYLDAALPLSILMLSFAFSLVGGSFLGNMVLIPSKKEGTYMIICCITAAVNVTLNYILIPIGGVNAAALTTSISSLLIMVLLLIKKDKRIRLNYIWSVMWKPLLGAVLVFTYCRFISYFIFGLTRRIVICIIGGVFIYFVLLTLTKCSIINEVIHSITHKFKKGKPNG